MNYKERTPIELQRDGIEALSKALGPVDMVRFLQLYDPGKGNYTAERDTLLGEKTVSELVAELAAQREGKNP